MYFFNAFDGLDEGCLCYSLGRVPCSELCPQSRFGLVPPKHRGSPICLSLWGLGTCRASPSASLPVSEGGVVSTYRGAERSPAAEQTKQLELFLLRR